MQATQTPGPTQITFTPKPVEVHSDGAVTLRLAPEAWPWMADAVVTAVSNAKFESDLGTYFTSAADDLTLEGDDQSGVDACAALIVCGLAALGRAGIGQFVAWGLESTCSDRTTTALQELAKVGVLPLYRLGDGADGQLANLKGADALVADLVEVFS